MSNIIKNKIAVIGLDCKFPGQSNGPDQFWQTLLNKKDGIVPVPADRWDHSLYYDKDGAKGKTFVQSAGFISGVFDFSPSSFGISEREAAEIDPQQRLLIQSSWNSIQNAGYKIDTIKEKTGVFFGLSYRDYYDFDIAPGGANSYTASNPLGTINAIAAGRVAYLLGLNGPAIQLDTICSSSLMTLHLACQSLLNEDCDYALSGGVSCILSPHALVALAQMGALSKSARCQAFSKHADGYIRGEGVGTLLLKRLEAAQRDCDYIYGIVEGTATNHDGRSNGLTAPNGKAQTKLITSCLEKAGLSPADVGYVEAHGTGTYLGDPVELEALYQVFGSSKSNSDPLFVGSVKSNIGHLEPAAGVASLIKSLLILKNDMIPPGLHLEELNPGFKWDQKAIVPVKERMAFENAEKRIGISAFSMTGANVHAILGKAPRQFAENSTNDAITKWPVLLSAQNDSTLNQYISSILCNIDEKIAIADLSNTLMNGREVFEESIYAYCDTIQEFIQELSNYQNGAQTIFEKVSLKTKRKPKHAELNIGNFPDFNMADLQAWKKLALFNPSIAKIDQTLQKLIGKPLNEVMLGLDKELEQKIARFSMAYLWADSIVSSLKIDARLNTTAEGDYLGAVFAEILTIEESLLLYILDDGPKRSQLLEKIRFRTGNHRWKKSNEAVIQEFWLKKNRGLSSTGISLRLPDDALNLSISEPDTTELLSNFLLHSYAKGLEIDWNAYTANKQLMKVPLPPAPLHSATYISESYKINSRKAPGIPGHLQQPGTGNFIASILHQQESAVQANRNSFSSIFSPQKDSFIRAHMVSGTYIFPGAAYISMIFEALSHLDKSQQISLKNVQIFQPMSFSTIAEKKEVKLEISYDLKNIEAPFFAKGSWEIRSRITNCEWDLHVKGSFGLRTANTPSENEAPSISPKPDKLSPVDTRAFYDHLNNWGIAYGPEFRLVTELSSSTDSMVALVQQQSTTDLLVSPELLDACMHALFSAKTFEQFSSPFVPSRYQEINLYQPLRGTVQARGTLLESGTDALNAQFSFCDTQGNPILEIKSMEIRKILEEFLPLGQDKQLVYQEKWEPLGTDANEEHTVQGTLQKDIWVFMDAGQAREVSNNPTTVNASVPLIVLLGQQDQAVAQPNLACYKDISDLIKNQGQPKAQFMLFAPPDLNISKFSGVFTLFKELLLNIPNEMNFRLCTINAMAVHPGEQVNPFQTALWGLARTMPTEAKQRWKGVIDILSIQHSALLMDPQLKPLIHSYDQLVLRGKTLYTPVLTTETAVKPENQQIKADWTDPVLITGGLGQMGRVFTEQLVRAGCKNIYLLSRNPAWLEASDQQAEDLNLSPSQLDFRRYIRKCQSEGISISTLSGKVDSDRDMAAIAGSLKDQGIERINLIHTAGAITRSKLTEASIEELEKEWKVKYEGAVQLDKQFASFEVGFTLYTSSIASLWSGEGLAGYSSANLLLDGLAGNRNLAGKRTLSVRFGRFAEKGLMKDHEALELEASGILTIPMHVAVDKAMELAGRSNLSTPGIMHINWERFTSLYQLLNHNRLLSLLTSPQSSIPDDTGQPEYAADIDKPLAEIITAMVADELEIDLEDVDPSVPLFELGLDSVHSLGIRTDLEKLLKIKLSVSLIYDFNTVELLSKHLEELCQKAPVTAGEIRKEQSEEDLFQLLMQELN